MQFESSLTLISSHTPFLLEKRIKLLKAIKKEGSITKAAKLVPMSYKTAWEAVDCMNNLCSNLIVKKEIGGKGGGGATLTLYGKNLLRTYSILQKEHKKFLESLTNYTDFHTGNLKSLKRFSMQISARNQIVATIKEIVEDKVSTNIILQTKSGQIIVSTISKHSIDDLGLKIEDEIIAIFKSNNVMIATNELFGFSARNKLKAKIKNLMFNNISCEVQLAISNNEILTSIITKKAAIELDLKINKEVFAVIKSSDIMLGK